MIRYLLALLFKITLIILSIVMLVHFVDYKTWSNDWNNSIDNPLNNAYVLEVAFNLNIPTDKVTQYQFYKRYSP